MHSLSYKAKGIDISKFYGTKYRFNYTKVFYIKVSRDSLDIVSDIWQEENHDIFIFSLLDGRHSIRKVSKILVW